jgi:hypothetical protein
VNTAALILWIVSLVLLVLASFWAFQPAATEGRRTLGLNLTALGIAFFAAAWGVQVAPMAHTIHFG